MPVDGRLPLPSLGICRTTQENSRGSSMTSPGLGTAPSVVLQGGDMAAQEHYCA